MRRPARNAPPVAARRRHRRSPSAARSGPPSATTADDSEALRRLDELGSEGTIVADGHGIPLTNLDKVLFPGRGTEPAATKRDLVRYLLTVAPVLLPHLAGRAVNLHRYPSGARDPGFWQK